jgi:ribosome biogenesis GTPase
MPEGTVVRPYSDFVDVALDPPRGSAAEPQVVQARLRGRLALRQGTEKNALAVGDRVTVSVSGHESMVEDIHPRRSRFSRRHPQQGLEQVIAANVDQVMILSSAERPEFRPDIVDLFLVAASAAKLPALLVLTKCDLVADSRPELLAKRYRKLKLPILRVGLGDDASVDRLRRDVLAGRVTVMLGPSGVGKSTLRNRLLPSSRGTAPTAPVSEKSGEGRHVTTAATFEALGGPGGGFLVDTPGVRELTPWGVDPATVHLHYPEFADAECRFGNCRHVTEPSCGVKAAVERGDATEDRYASMIAIARLLRGEAPA